MMEFKCVYTSISSWHFRFDGVFHLKFTFNRSTNRPIDFQLKLWYCRNQQTHIYKMECVAKTKAKATNVWLLTAQRAQVQLQNRNISQSMDWTWFCSLFVMFTIDRDIQISWIPYSFRIILCNIQWVSGCLFCAVCSLLRAGFSFCSSHQRSCQLSIYSFDERMFVVDS